MSTSNAKQKLHVRKGDHVVIIAGKEKGKQGLIIKVLTDKSRVIVEKANMIKRHTRPSNTNPQGGIVEKEGSIHASNVMLWCTKCNTPGRVKRAEMKDGGRVRVCRNCGEMFLTDSK